jgi:NAD(P)-dependent dehydrogenase (short-subunit alcohol dehydrogenase family)
VTFSEAKPHRSRYPHGSEKGQVSVVTGGNASIGFELCEVLRSSGATIYMASRSQASLLSHHLFYASTFPTAKAYQDRSRNQNHHLHFLNPKTDGKLNFLHLDLNGLLSVKAAATSFASQESKLEVLWNNTGTGPNGFKEV